ncbi:hypothetical protein D3C72_1961390 [compost metagenome]
MLGDDVVEMGRHALIVGQFEAQAIGGDDLAPHFTIFHAIGQRGQCIGPVLRLAGAQEGIHGGRRGDLRQRTAVVTFGLPGHHLGLGQRHLRQRLPYRAIIGIDGQRLPIGHQRGGIIIGRHRFFG